MMRANVETFITINGEETFITKLGVLRAYKQPLASGY